MVKRKIKVVKIPLENNQVDRPQAFPKMSRLYLELLENKSKIKQDLINKEYDGKPSLNFIDSNNKNYQINDDNKGENYEKSSPENSNSDSEKSSPENSEKSSPENSDSDSEKSSPENESKNFDRRLDNLLSDKKDDRGDDKKDYRGDDKKDDIGDIDDIDSVKSAEEDNLSIRLKELLKYDKNSIDSNKRRGSIQNKSNDKYSKHIDKNYKYKNSPPTLAELESRGVYQSKKELRDINQASFSEEQEEDLKRELLFKFEMLQKSYNTASIPEFSIHSDYNSMKKTYESTVRRLSLDSSIEQYKTYLIGGFMACEYIFGYFLGFDMQDFTKQQIISMHSYEKLLIELGEKSYVPTGSNWPVEIRLLGLIIINAALFVISKMIMKNTGANLLGMINNMNMASTSQPQQKKKKMSGPSINLDDIPQI